MKKKIKSSENKAKDVVTPKLKSIDIPNSAKVEIRRMNERLEIYLSGIVVGMRIKGKWDYDAQNMKIIIEDTDGKKT